MKLHTLLFLAALMPAKSTFAQDAKPALRQGTAGEVVPQLKNASLIPNADFDNGLQNWTVRRDEGVTAEIAPARIKYFGR